MDTESADMDEVGGDLVYLECKCCHVRMEHRCPAEKMKVSVDGANGGEPSPPKTRKRRGKGSRSPAKKAALTMAPLDGSFGGGSGEEGGEANGGTLTLSTRANREKKSAVDYLRQLACDDLKVTDDGLDIFCVKCDKALSKVALGQRIRIDNLFSHVKSSSHLKVGQNEVKEEPTAAYVLLNSEDVDMEAAPAEEEPTATPPSVGKRGRGGRRGRKSNGVTPKTPSEKKPKKAHGSRQKTAAEYVEKLQCPEVQVAADGLNLECIACERLITRLDKGQRIRIDNITTHINSGQHRKLAEKRLYEGGGEGGSMPRDNSEEATRVVEFPANTSGGSGTSSGGGGGRSGGGRSKRGGGGARGDTEEHSEFLMSVGLSTVAGDGDEADGDGNSFTADPSTSAAVATSSGGKKRSKRKGIPSKDKGLLVGAESED